MATPTDPLYPAQWHLTQMGDIETIWDEFTGKGVNVGVYDTQLQYTHPDIAPNYDSSLHIKIGDTVYDPIFTGISGQEHSTSVTGLIGAAANNGQGVVGGAFGASLTAVSIFDGGSDLFINAGAPNGYFAALQSLNFDVTNGSYGSTPLYHPSQNTTTLGTFANVSLLSYQFVSELGRDGLGTVVLRAAGNDARHASGSGENNIRFLIDVAALAIDGTPASYSNHGANILVSAPAGETGNLGPRLTTTDLLGSDGYNNSDGKTFDYTDLFNGTSAATPVTAGVVALMLEANPDLGWRDVQNIIANSASHVGAPILLPASISLPSFDGEKTSVVGDPTNRTADMVFADAAPSAPGFEDGFWFFNGATNWNGGGLHFNIDHGFGIINAYNAVRMAEVWTLFGPAATSANETSVLVSSDTSTPIPDVTVTDIPFTVTENIRIENVQLELNITHTWFPDLRIALIAPDGSAYEVMDEKSGANSGTADAGINWAYGINGLREVSSLGQWTIRIVDAAGGDSGTLNGFSVRFFGSPATSDTVHHITDEFTALVALEPFRGVITDSDGGTDWLDLSTIATDVTLDLAPGAISTFAPPEALMESGLGGIATVTPLTAFTLSAAEGTEIENAITGDGKDSLTGNSLDNALYGMRGDDVLDGLGGNDTLDGGAGLDKMAGGKGNDSYFVDNKGDTVFENVGEGLDEVFSSITFALRDHSQNIENLTLTGSANIDGTGNIQKNYIYGNEGNNTINGAAGNDVLYGGLGNDTFLDDSGADLMYGGKGNDTYHVDNPGDFIYENKDEGSDTVVTAFTYALNAVSQNVEDLTLTGKADIDGTGNVLKNTITGNDGNNTLDGAAGDDVLIGGFGNDTFKDANGADKMMGGIGNDTYYVDNPGDSIVENLDEGADKVFSSVSFALRDHSQHLEDLILTGTSKINGTGNALVNTITGNEEDNILNGASGDDILLGGKGNDTFKDDSGIDKMSGGLGHDVYYVDDAKDQIFENVNEGYDEVITALNFALRDYSGNLEGLTLAGKADVSGTGNLLNNIIFGNDGNNTLNGAFGNDSLYGGNGNDTFKDDGGADKMAGGLGHDTYYVDNVGDALFENKDEGFDTVFSSISFALRDHSQNLEILTLTGPDNIDGTGNVLNNTITGNDGNNTLNGAAGKDTLIGGKGDDTFKDDSGADKMDGGLGDDTYYVDNIGDTILEGVNAGLDRVFASISFALRDFGNNIEDLTLLSTDNLDGTGNVQANKIVGNAGNNLLNGAFGNDVLIGGEGNDTFKDDGGADLMIGGIGHDTYYVDDAKDSIFENVNEGFDKVFSTVSFALRDTSQNLETLTLMGKANIDGTGNVLNNTITGNDGNNTLNGAVGNDTLIGGGGNDTFLDDGGNDTFTGGTGADTFKFAGSFGKDTVTDFQIAVVGEVIDLTGVAAIVDFTDLTKNHLTEVGGNAIISDGLGNTITLTGVLAGSLTAGDFIF